MVSPSPYISCLRTGQAKLILANSLMIMFVVWIACRPRPGVSVDTTPPPHINVHQGGSNSIGSSASGLYGHRHTEYNTTLLASANHSFASRIATVCKRIQDGYYVIPPPEEAEDSQLKGVVDNYSKVMFCDIHKVASTSWQKMIHQLVRREKNERQRWFSEHPYTWRSISGTNRYSDLSKLGFNSLSVGSEAHDETKEGLPDPREEYYKFIVVRHPLERLASAFLDKLGKGKAPDVEAVKKHVGRWNRGAAAVNNTVNDVTFEDFLRFVSLPDTEIGNQHFRSYQAACHPCTMYYDYVAKLETLQTDLIEILPHLNAMRFKDNFPHSKFTSYEAKHQYRYAHMYTSLPDSVLQPLFDKYKVDADMFDYNFDSYKHVQHV